MAAIFHRGAGGRLLILLVPVLVYANSLHNPFQYDDSHSIVENPHIRTLENIPAFFVDSSMFSANPESAMYRPLLLSSFALNYAISGYEVWSYHLLGLALHLGCVYLVFLCGEILLGDRLAAGLAALIFGVHPINTEPLNYISSRSEILAGFFVLLGLWAFLRWRREHRGAALLVAAYAAGLLSKSIVVVLPGILLCYEVLFDRRRLVDQRKIYALLGLVALSYVAAVWKFLHKASIGAPVRSYSEQIWSQVKALVFYLKLLLWPQDLNVDHQFLISDSFFDPFDPIAASAFCFIVSLLALTIYHRQRHPLLLFLLVFALLVLAPSTLIPLNVLVNEHRLYLPSAAFALALAYAGVRVAGKGPSWKKAVVCGTLVLLLCYAGATISRNRIWQSPYTLWKDAASKAPLMARPYFYLGQACADRGEVGAAIAALEHGLQRDPGFTVGYARLGQLYLLHGQVQEAEKVFQRGLDKDPQDAVLWKGLGEMYRTKGQMGKSLQAYQQALTLAPGDHALLNNLGNTLQKLNRPREALEYHRQALSLNPADAATYVNIGAAHYMLGDLDAAGRAFARAVEADPSSAIAWYNLGVVHQDQGSGLEALEAYRRAAGLDRQYAELLQESLRLLQESLRLLQEADHE